MVYTNLFTRGGVFTVCYKPGAGASFVAFSCPWNITGPKSLSNTSNNRTDANCVPTGIPVTLNITGNALVPGPSGDRVRVLPVQQGGQQSCSSDLAETPQVGNTNTLSGPGGSWAQYTTTFLRGGSYLVCYRASGGDYVALSLLTVCGPANFTPNGTVVVCVWMLVTFLCLFLSRYQCLNAGYHILPFVVFLFSGWV